ncbi:DUF3833 domain-containing protein [Janthinobacterium lividum]|nr:DUF3833 domain-containing protein [Janthinobacterium lividum]QKY11491.1 DUF3833 domain-containing protein [Janthinobacterium lividum]
MSYCKRRLPLAVLMLALAACSTPPTPATYAQELPILDLQQYFNGTLDAHGIFQDRSGKVVKRFTVVMRASWVRETGTLDEDFTYSDGSRQRRVWTLRKTASGRFIGTAPDVIGEAIGEVAGNALRWQYVLALPVDGTVYHVDFEDWMFLMDDKVMLNRAAMSKFGFSLGAVTLSFSKRPQAAP